MQFDNTTVALAVMAVSHHNGGTNNNETSEEPSSWSQQCAIPGLLPFGKHQFRLSLLHESEFNYPFVLSRLLLQETASVTI